MSLLKRLLIGSPDSAAFLFCPSHWDKSLTCHSVADPDDPVEFDVLVSTTTFDEITRVALDTNTQIAYVATESLDGISSVDFSSPVNLTQLDTLNMTVICTDIAIDATNEVAYLTRTQWGLIAIDISDPTNLTLLDEYVHTNYVGWYCSSINLVSNRVYNGGTDTMVVVNVSDPSNMILDYAVALPLGGGNPTFIHCDGPNERVYIVFSTYLFCYDTSLSGTVTTIKNITIDADCVNGFADMTNEVLYTLHKSGDKIEAWDISDPSTSIPSLGSYTSSSDFIDPLTIVVDEEDQVAYVALLNFKLVTLDVSDPSAISVTNTFTTTEQANEKNNLALYKGA